MDKRPRSITIISWIFIVFGSIALLASLLEIFNTATAQRGAYLKGHWMIPVVRLLALVAGVFMLYGFNWARWLLVVWLAYHVVLGAFHSALELVVHSLLFAVVLYFLFRRQASAYFLRNG
jgi:hypothetical protein